MLKAKNDWKTEYTPEATEWFSTLQSEVSVAWATAEKMYPNIPWIEDFIYRAYTQ